MVVMFVEYCVGGGRYFLYYSSCRNLTGREFFCSRQNLIAFKLLIGIVWHLSVKVRSKVVLMQLVPL